MRRKSLRTCLVAGLSGPLLWGCASGPGRHPFPPDPLLLDRKPLQGKAETAGPRLVAQAEPAPPALPPLALASAAPPFELQLLPAPAHPDPLQRVPLQSPAIGRASSRSVPATLASRQKPSAEVTALPAIRRLVPETYGHGSDYSWLQGVLGRDATGRWTLRYAAGPTPGPGAGQVAFVEKPRLGEFQVGDVVLVEGEIAPESSARPLKPGPAWYRVHEIWLVKRNPPTRPADGRTDH